MIKGVFGVSAAVHAAASNGLLASVIEHPERTAAQHAAATSLDPRGASLVLEVLVAYDIAARTGDTIGPSEELALVVNTAPGGLAGTLAMWSHVPTFLRTGDPFLKMDAARESSYAGVVAALGRMSNDAARELAGKLSITPSNVLDIGCGSGVWSLAIATRHPSTRVTGLDLPAVLEAFRARATELGLSDRVATLPGDVHELSPSRQFDLVVIANVLRIESPERARAIVHRAATAIVPGGKLLVVDALAGGTPDREQARAVYALHLGMRTVSGRVYSRAEITGWMNEVGLREEQVYDLDANPGAVGAILAG